MAPVSRIHVLVPALVVLGWTGAAHATEMDDFQRAQSAYQQNEFEEAVRLFEEMIVPVPAIRDPLLIQESRKYLGAAYVFVGRQEEAERQFEAFLRDEEDFATYQLDPALFPTDVISLFQSVRDRLVEERAQESDRERELLLRREERRRQALLTLVSLAQENEVGVTRDPTLSWLPFGAGQFNNGNEGLGWFFAVTEGLTLLGSVAAMSAYVPLELEHARDFGAGGANIPDELRGGLYWGAIGGGLAFLGLAVAGVIEAHLSFRPRRTVREPREIPPDVLQELDLAVGPGSVSLRLRF